MNKKALNILEYDRIKEAVLGYAQNEVSAALISEMEPTNNQAWIESQLAQLDEARIIHMQGSEPGMSRLTNVAPLTKRAEIGSMLSVAELNRVKNNIRVTNRYKTYLLGISDEEELSLPLLNQQFSKLPVLSHVSEAIEEKCDETQLYDNASPVLYDIRQKKKTINRRIKEKLDQIVRSSANQKKLSDAIVTIRNDRQVIPVRSEYKQDFPGIVHDTSASGQTFYIEPNSIVELSSQLNAVTASENEEVSRILYELSSIVASERNDIDWVTRVMGELDEQLAKAKYGHSIKGVVPEILTERGVDLPLAWHPLLDQQTVVKNSIRFGDDIQAVIITGPNTGGKTVTLKTLGLIILMTQSGLMIPAGEGAAISIFNEVFCDIGDEQSIEQSLSTFSSHMTNIVSILEQMDDRSFVLFDELGSGTDPSEGAALAMSILDRCLEQNVMMMATTHYPELKAYSFNREHVINASVEFNVETLSPTYKLLMGVPGKSNAFEISKKLGLDLSIIKRARQLIHMDNVEVNDMISSLEKNSRQAENERTELERLRKEAEQLHQQLSDYMSQYNHQKEKMMEEAKQSANDIVTKAEKQADEIIKELKSLRTEQQGIKENELIDQKGKFKDLYQETSFKKKNKVEKMETIEAGDHVKVLTYGQKGVILSVDGDEAVVQMGIIKMKLPLAEMQKEKPEKQKEIRVVPRANRQTIKMELDLRGERYEDALQRLENYLDQALLSNYSQVTIIHGKGTGALQKGVQDFLKRSKNVASFRGGLPSEGGFGVTVVELK